MLDRPENLQSSPQWKTSHEFNAAAHVELGEIGLFSIAMLSGRYKEVSQQINLK